MESQPIDIASPCWPHAPGERPQAIVPAQAWQAAQSLGEWTLIGATVAPGFEFSIFELAPKGWAPAGATV
jgi:uncharacterized protein